MTPLARDYAAMLEAVSLQKSSHKTREQGMCAMEAAAYISGEPHSDHPACVSKVITVFLINWNDSIPTDTDRNRIIKPLLPLIIDTAADKDVELRRSFMALEWLLRECAPTFLALTPSLVEHAEALRSSPEVTTPALVKAIQPKLDAASDAARNAARNAARVAAWDAASDAARNAAWVAVWDAARVAAWDAARVAAWAAASDAARNAARAAASDAARNAAWVAVWDAASDALKPAVESLQASAVLLVKRMVEAK